jgi:hypothetical protein
LRSSNFPFYAAVWDTAKGCEGVVALEKKFHWNPHPNSDGSDPIKSEANPRAKKTNALVDVVAQDGSEWIKISTVTEKRILFDLAKAGWVGDSSGDEEYECDGFGAEDDEPEGLVKQAEALMKASKSTRVRYRHPSIRIVLPKIKYNCVPEVEAILKQVQAMGITIQRVEDIQKPPSLSSVLDKMAVNPFASFSDTINIDCTILLALISDLSHATVEAEAWHHRAVVRQIEMEKYDQLLPTSLWPACDSRALLCTREAAQRMNEIVDLIGTETEKLRRDLLMETDGTSSWTRERRIEALQDTSSHKIPSALQLPIQVVEVNIEELKHSIGPLSIKVAKSLSTINQSVFLYGWGTGKTTISSNRTVTKEIETIVEGGRKGEDDRGPDIWLCPTSRSLVGKEKKRRNWNNV